MADVPASPPAADAFVAAFRDRFAQTRTAVEAAIAQVEADALTRPLGGPRSDEGENTIAVLMHHVGGNLASRFTDFLTTDGEKPTRDRDREFADVTPDAARRAWDAGWATLVATLGTLTDADLTRTVAIRRAPMSVLDALVRSLAHVSQHAGQIVLLAKHHAGAAWTPLTIPRGRSGDYATRVFDGPVYRG